MKKMFAVLLALCMALTCLTMASAEEKTYHVGILQLVQHEALDAATKGFRDALTEKLGDKVVFDEQNASGDTASCAMIANGFVAAKVDLIMATRRPRFRRRSARRRIFRFSARRFPTTARRWKSATGRATRKSTFPARATSPRWTVRRT